MTFCWRRMESSNPCYLKQMVTSQYASCLLLSPLIVITKVFTVLSHTFGRGFNYTPVCTLLLSIYTHKHVLSFRLELTVYFSSQVLMANASDSICKSKGWKEQLQGLSNAQEWAPPFSSVSTTQDLAVC